MHRGPTFGRKDGVAVVVGVCASLFHQLELLPSSLCAGLVSKDKESLTRTGGIISNN